MTAVAEDPSTLTPLQWLKRALQLPVGELLARLSRLTSSLYGNLRTVSRLQRMAISQNKSLHVVILADRLGDIIAAEPVLRAIKRPNEFVAWMVRPRFRGLLEFNPHVESIIEVSSYTEAAILARIFRHIRITNLYIHGNLCNIFGIKINNRNTSGIDGVNYYNHGTLSDVYSLIGTGTRSNLSPQIYLDPDFDFEKFKCEAFGSTNRPLLALHAASDELARSWSLEKATAFVEWLLEHTNFNIVELGLSPALAGGPRVVLLRDRLSLPAQMALIGQCDLFIGVDSGFAHVANAAGVPSIYLIGEYRGFRDYLPWPVKGADLVLRSQSQAADIDVESVIGAVTELTLGRHLAPAP